MSLKEVENIRDIIHIAKVKYNLTLDEWLHLLSHLILETGVSLYKKQGNLFNEQSLDIELQRVELEYFKNPSLGGALIVQSKAIKELNQFFTQNDKSNISRKEKL